jgi:hypothetical protein
MRASGAGRAQRALRRHVSRHAWLVLRTGTVSAEALQRPSRDGCVAAEPRARSRRASLEVSCGESRIPGLRSWGAPPACCAAGEAY